MINKERLLKLADILDSAPEYNENDNETSSGFNMMHFYHDCGAPSCIAGYATSIAIKEGIALKGSNSRDKAEHYLGLTPEQSWDLFLPMGLVGPDDEYDPYKINGKQAAKVVRHFAETNIINFEVAFEDN